MDAGLLRITAAVEKRSKAAESGLTRGQARLQVLELTNDFHLRSVLDMAFTTEAVFIGFAYIQSTFNPVFASMWPLGKITSTIWAPP